MNNYDYTKLLAQSFDNENWKHIKGNNRFAISDAGRIYDLNKNKEVKQYTNKEGYQIVYLNDYNKKDYPKAVHRLVAEAFIDNPNNFNVVNHKDEDKTNNNINNLEWCTQSYNMNYGTINERRKESISKAVQYRKQLEEANKTIEELKNEIVELKTKLQKYEYNDSLSMYDRAKEILSKLTNNSD